MRAAIPAPQREPLLPCTLVDMRQDLTAVLAAMEGKTMLSRSGHVASSKRSSGIDGHPCNRVETVIG
jgi:hypothetical protein